MNSKKININKNSDNKIDGTKNNIINSNKKSSNKKNNSSYIKIFIILVAIFLIGTAFTFVYYMNYQLLDYKEINATAKIVEIGAGINADPGGLYFGKNGLGGGATRSYTIVSKVDAIIRMVPEGNISDFLVFPENNFLIKANETKKVYVSLEVPADAKVGFYSGKVKVYLLRP